MIIPAPARAPTGALSRFAARMAASASLPVEQLRLAAPAAAGGAQAHAAPEPPGAAAVAAVPAAMSTPCCATSA